MLRNLPVPLLGICPPPAFRAPVHCSERPSTVQRFCLFLLMLSDRADSSSIWRLSGSADIVRCEASVSHPPTLVVYLGVSPKPPPERAGPSLDSPITGFQQNQTIWTISGLVGGVQRGCDPPLAEGLRDVPPVLETPPGWAGWVRPACVGKTSLGRGATAPERQDLLRCTKRRRDLWESRHESLLATGEARTAPCPQL